MAGAFSYVRRRQVDWGIARWSIIGGVPGTVAGALLSLPVGGKPLLVASGVVLIAFAVYFVASLPHR